MHKIPDNILYQRLKKTEVYQHNLVMVSFIVLAFTGFLALIPIDTIELWFGQYGRLIYLLRGYIHRIFAAILIATSIWHVLYLAATKNGRKLVMDILPTKKDLADLVGFFKYVFGNGEKPQFDRFDYREKLEYITGGIGQMIITVTGIILTFSGYFTKFVVDISAAVHLLEATLATMAVSVWHMYAVHIKPGKFPMSTIWIDGKMPLHELEEEHPFYYETVIKPKLTSEEVKPGSYLEKVDGPRKLDRIARGITAKWVTVVSLLFLVVINISLIKSLYFKKTETAQAVQLEEVSIFEKILEAETELRTQHFHNLDVTVKVEERIPTLCLRCHGNRPHTHSKEVRSLLNMHTYFAACELCHNKVDDLTDQVRGTFKVNWYDNLAGEIISTIQPRSGNYNAKLIPSVAVEGKRHRLDRPVTEEYAKEYMEKWMKYSYDQQAQAKAEIHKGLSQKPVQCNECHRRDEPYLDYVSLSYPRNWVEELTGAEVAGMIDKYMTFYIPSMFNPDEIRREREELMRLRQEIGEQR